MSRTTKDLNGIRGGLILIAIGVIFAPVFQLFEVGYYGNILTTEKWSFFTDPTAPFFQPYLKPLLYFQILGNVTLLILSIFILIYFFKKRRIVPKMVILFLSSNLLLFSVGYYMVKLIPTNFPIEQLDRLKSIEEIILQVIICLIWIPYFLISKRVRNTFNR